MCMSVFSLTAVILSLHINLFIKAFLENKEKENCQLKNKRYATITPKQLMCVHDAEHDFSNTLYLKSQFILNMNSIFSGPQVSYWSVIG